MSPFPSPRPLRLTKRDLDLLDALGSYRFLSTAQVAVLFFRARRTAQNRLGQLLSHELIVRLHVPVRPYDPKACAVYALGAKGARLLAPRHDGHLPRYLPRKDVRSGLYLHHTLRRNDLRICLTLLDRTLARLDLVRWDQDREHVRTTVTVRDSRRARAVETVSLVPDGCFTVFTPKGCEAFAVEIDLGTVSPRRMAQRYRAYWRWWRRNGPSARFGPTPFRVLTLAPSEARLRSLHRAALSAPENGGRGSGLFWFASLDILDLEDPEQLLAAVWRVARTGETGPRSLFND